MADQVRTITLEGGLDLVTPQIAMEPGKMVAGLNYEPGALGKGYHRIEGYERFDGMPAPSDQTYWVLTFTAGGKEPQLGRVVTGATSGAVGTVVVIVLTSGSWVGADAAGYLVIRLHTGAFVAAESITVSEPIAFTSGFSSGFN